MFLLDFLNGFEVVDCEDFDEDYEETCYKHRGCNGCRHIYSHIKYGDDHWDSDDVFKYASCSKRHIIVTVKIVLASHIKHVYDTHGILQDSFIDYKKELRISFRTNVLPSKITHEQRKCEEITETVTRTQCSTEKLDGPPDGYE